MKNINLIGISGKIKSGKDTTGKIIQYLTSDYVNKCDFETYLKHTIDFPEWKIKKFAGKLKEIVSILTGISIIDLEKQEVKDMVLGEEWWYYKGEVGIYPYNTPYEANKKLPLIKPTPRMLLQEIGTDLFRNQLHPNIHINALFADIDKELDVNPNYNKKGFIITDVRFSNELQSIKDRGGISIRVNRLNSTNQNGYTYINKKDRTHPSETDLDDATFDHVIDNNGTIDELIVKVKEILIKENIINESL